MVYGVVYHAQSYFIVTRRVHAVCTYTRMDALSVYSHHIENENQSPLIQYVLLAPKNTTVLEYIVNTFETFKYGTQSTDGKGRTRNEMGMRKGERERVKW